MIPYVATVKGETLSKHIDCKKRDSKITQHNGISLSFFGCGPNSHSSNESKEIFFSLLIICILAIDKQLCSTYSLIIHSKEDRNVST